VRSAARVLQAAHAQGVPLVYVDEGRLHVLARLDISTQAKAFIVDAVQRGYGVLTPERMVDWNGAQTVAWWQLDLETGEMVGVGEDGTHQFLVQFTGEIRVFAITVQMIWMLTKLILARILAWRDAATMTWDYFWRKAKAIFDASDPGMSPQEVYQKAFEETKRYMRETAWPAFEEEWENDSPLGIPPEWLQ
jgi:hypothetical protein